MSWSENNNLILLAAAALLLGASCDSPSVQDTQGARALRN